jgi:hypothetical protein
MDKMESLYRRFNEACDAAGVTPAAGDYDTMPYEDWRSSSLMLLEGRSVLEVGALVTKSSIPELLKLYADPKWHATAVRAVIMEHLCLRERVLTEREEV